jgi:hypothetical protein
MARGVINDYLSLYFVRPASSFVANAYLRIIADSFYKNIVLYMTQFWVCYLVIPPMRLT